MWKTPQMWDSYLEGLGDIYLAAGGLEVDIKYFLHLMHVDGFILNNTSIFGFAIFSQKRSKLALHYCNFSSQYVEHKFCLIVTLKDRSMTLVV